jgi:hypothetical protein
MERKFNVKVEKSHEFSIDDINDLVCSALDGGINYWCGKAKIKKNVDGTFVGVASENHDKVKYCSDVIGYDGVIILYDAESSDKWELTLESMLKGISMYCSAENVVLSDLLDEHDAGTADSIIQYALFNEIVFG